MTARGAKKRTHCKTFSFPYSSVNGSSWQKASVRKMESEKCAVFICLHLSAFLSSVGHSFLFKSFVWLRLAAPCLGVEFLPHGRSEKQAFWTNEPIWDFLRNSSKWLLINNL